VYKELVYASERINSAVEVVKKVLMSINGVKFQTHVIVTLTWKYFVHITSLFNV